MAMHKLVIEYYNVAFGSIQVGTFTAIGTPTLFPICEISIQNGSDATYELSLDGVNPFAFVDTQTNSPGWLQISFGRNGLLQPKTQLWARRVAAGAAGSIRFTILEQSNRISSTP